MTEHLDQIDLVQAIAAVREQLKEAAVQAANEDIQFEVEGLEIEFQVELRQDERAKVGAKAWVLNASAELGDSRLTSNRVRISLKPQYSTSGQSIKISEEKSTEASDFPFS
ncbi:trypco2 family protein [Streptomyces sp. NPDC048252]|uniref:trypco2 family protein n=1 Tax=Streptomyces sp. NPDC048252 TaxID=3154612 RepID=UPI00343A1CB9